MRAVARRAIERHAGQKLEELVQFLDILQAIKPKVMVEIGVAAGGSLYAWKQVCPLVIGIDPNSAADLCGDSHNPTTLARLTERLTASPVDCLFIDGDHTYDGVRQDYEMYGPLVRPGGLIAFHDIACHGVEGVEVDRFWAEVRNETAREIIDPHGGGRWGDNWGGIGVLVK